MKTFNSLRKKKQLINGYEIIIYLGTEEKKIYHDILPVGLSETGHKTYKGLMVKEERDYYDNIFTIYGNNNILDIEIEPECCQIFIFLEEVTK